MDQIYYIFSKYYHDTYRESLNLDNPNISDLINKKFIHTFRVIDNIKTICYKENLNEDILYLAEVAALFHDIGRFSQVLRYGHFNDLKSFDHANESADIFMKNKNYLLEFIKEEDILKIEKSIRYHNKLEIPSNESNDVVLLTKILKDADKLNILSINLKSNFVSFDGKLIATEKINEDCLNDFKNNRVVNSKHVSSILDNNVKLLSWIYDLNFKTSLEMYSKETFIDILTDTTYIQNNSIKNILLDLKDISNNYLNCRLY